MIGSPIICSTLATVYDWDWGFGAAGVGMVIGLTVYLIGRPTFPRERSRSRGDDGAVRPPLQRRDWLKLLLLVALVPVLAVGSLGNQEIFNAYLVWGEANYQLLYYGWHVPAEYLVSLDSGVSTAMLLLTVLFWRWYATRWAEPAEITKIALGVAISASAPLALAVASVTVAATGQKAGLGWAVLFEIVNDIGFSNVFPVGLALYSRTAPRGYAGIMIGIYYVHLFAGNLLVGWVGGLFEKMSGSAFWLLHAGLIFAAALVLFTFRAAFGHLLAPAYYETAAATKF